MALEYPVEIYRLVQSDGGGYLAMVRDLPGCMSDGETPEEALKNVQEAITSWIEAAKEWKIFSSASRIRSWRLLKSCSKPDSSFDNPPRNGRSKKR